MSSTPENGTPGSEPLPGSQPPAETRVGQLLREAINTWQARKDEKKRKRSGGDGTDIASVLDRAARTFVRVHHPFKSVVSTFKVGISCDINNAEDPTRLLTTVDRQLNSMTTEERLGYIDAFKVFLEGQPGLKQLFLSTENIDPGLVYGAIREMDTTARSARSDDTGSLKKDGLGYAVDIISSASPENLISILKRTHKSARGFHNIWIGQLFCPHRHSAMYAENPEGTCMQLQAGSLACTAENMPTCLYPQGQPYNPANRLDGLLRSPLCVRVYKHIFTGPASAEDLPESLRSGRRKQCQASLMGLERTTPRTIAYAAVQARHMLSSQAVWCLVDGSFNNCRFFDNIVALFETSVDADPTAQLWAKQTLDWWDQQIFEKGPRGTAAIGALDHPGVDEDDDFRQMMAPRLVAGGGTGNAQ